MAGWKILDKNMVWRRHELRNWILWSKGFILFQVYQYSFRTMSNATEPVDVLQLPSPNSLLQEQETKISMMSLSSTDTTCKSSSSLLREPTNPTVDNTTARPSASATVTWTISVLMTWSSGITTKSLDATLLVLSSTRMNIVAVGLTEPPTNVTQTVGPSTTPKSSKTLAPMTTLTHTMTTNPPSLAVVLEAEFLLTI